MDKIRFPENHQQVMPYFLVKGAQNFFDFISNVFGATELTKHTDETGAIRHAEATIGKSVIMFGDSTETWPPITGCVYVYVSNADDTYQKALSAGASSVMEPATMDYGRACGVKDPFGNIWWITSV